jgi:hypothetical protein
VIAAPASAQFYDDARRSTGLTLGPIERSPRLLGMGRMTYVGNDPHNRITLWDFAGNPTGILESDSVSTFELRPGTSSASEVHDVSIVPRTERQDFAARESRIGYEAWRRTEGTAAYGVAGEMATLRFDRPYDDTIERRTRLSLPSVMPVLTGRMPFTASGRWLYSVHLLYSGETYSDEYRAFTQNAAGSYIDRDGTLLGTPDFFTPKDYTVRSEGGGLTAAWKVAPWLTASIGGELVVDDIKGTNSAERHASEITDKRPYLNGQATLLGKLGPGLEYGIDARRWTASSEQRWLFTISAGVEAAPLAGRGKLLDRDEKGNEVRSRVRWTLGALELGAGLNTRFSEVTITPPGPGDRTSFSVFRNFVATRPGADSLDLADSVSFNRSEERVWDGGAGLAWRLPNGRGLYALEYHRGGNTLDQVLSGHGPERKVSDVRTGLEFQCSRAFAGRLGYQLTWDDLDTETRQNERVAHTLTLGAGIQPNGTRWSLDTGYAIQWARADYDDPRQPRSSRQQLATQIRWAF